ncbi:MAG: UMP kinase [Chitinivibrionales bacterium]
MRPVYKRVLLKISGEALAAKNGFGFDPATVDQIAGEIKEIHDAGVEMGIVIGGGNIFRGGTAEGIDRAAGDMIGMLATAINSLVLREYLENRGIDSRVLSAIDIPKAAEFFSSRRALHHLEKKRIVIIAGGTGNPYFTTDSAAALRCLEIRAEVLLKATKVDGIYDSDPVKNPAAKRFDSLTHSQALEKNLKIMDATAFSLCMEHAVPIIVFKLLEPGNLQKVIEGTPLGTIVKKGA